MTTTYTHTVSDYPLGRLPNVGDEVLVCDEHGTPERLALVTEAGSIQTGNAMAGDGNSLPICIGDADRDWDDLDASEQDRLYSDLHHVLSATDAGLDQIDKDAAAAAKLREMLEEVLTGSPAVVTQCDVTDGRALIQVAAPEVDHDDNGCTDYLTEAFEALDDASDEGQECMQMVGASPTGWVPVIVHTWTASV